MTNTHVLVDNFLRSAIGFDKAFARFADVGIQSGFPFWNYFKNSGTEDKYTLQIALAGYDVNDVKVTLKDQELKISSAGVVTQEDFITKGFTCKPFTRFYTLAKEVKITNIEMINGVLTISLEREIPEEQKERELKISVPKISTRQLLNE